MRRTNKKKNEQQPREVNWTDQGIKLLAVKIFNDYCLEISNGKRPEAESFFEIWVNRFLDKSAHKYNDKIWKIFIDMLWLRSKRG